MNQKQRVTLIFFTSLPLILVVMLFMINPAFIKKLFIANSAQPIGWLIAISVFILTGVAYFIQQKIYLLSQAFISTDQSTPSVLISSTLKKKELLFAYRVLLLILIVPAILLILLGPAILMLLQSFQ